ncbi:MAG: DUF1156 domain-containing protein [Deltaproteobacteria bacterium]|nr:DUF1156 domain-containing protein [Deltaproteobacteria bacterium]
MARGTNGGTKTKAQRIAEEVARVVNAGQPAAVETVDFSDPHRPLTCLEVDFPILSVNQVAQIEGNASKPIYQMSKWWARRRSSVFRSMLIAAAMKAPQDAARSAKAVWDLYYANFQKKKSLAHLKVADIFMGGGTTIVEGLRLGMQMYGNDLNPVAWFVVKNELAQVRREEVEALLEDVEREVKPQIMPFYACRGPHGEVGTWTEVASGQVMGEDFDPLALAPEERKKYRYDGPESIYVFWAKHMPCQRTGCGNRTPVLSSPVVAVKELTVKAWEHRCPACRKGYDIEDSEARMAPDVPLALAADEKAFAIIDKKLRVTCPHCGKREESPSALGGKGNRKKVLLTLLVHPQWMRGEKREDAFGKVFGGSVTDSAEATARWNQARAARVRLLEVRGALPDEVTCPKTDVKFRTDKGNVPKQSFCACGACGTGEDVLTAVKASGKTGPVAMYAIQGYSSKLEHQGAAYSGRFFSAASDTRAFEAAHREWEARKDADLAAYWPRSELPFGFMTHKLNGGIPNHGFTHWWTMFNPRQLLVHALLLKAITEVSGPAHRWEAREYVLGVFQQYLRNQNMFSFWNPQRDTPEPMFSNNNFHPKSTTIENCVFPDLGRGNWRSCTESLTETLEWRSNPWDHVAGRWLEDNAPGIAKQNDAKNEKAYPQDAIHDVPALRCESATELTRVPDSSHDLVITDPPFGGLLHYSELSDFFYVWLRLVLATRYPDTFTAEYTPKTLEAVSNLARNPENADEFYKRVLTECWREGHRILKSGGVLAFTFHHSEDEPWVAVLESLFDAGFYLEATYPIRSDETKGGGEFGAKKIEFDIIHVCRKRTGEPTPVSWAKMRRQVLQDVQALKSTLEHHRSQGLSEADLQVVRRGKALEYFSRHYGKVFIDDGKEMKVKDALVGINLLLDEDTTVVSDPPPPNAEPLTRQFLRVFMGQTEVKREEIQKYLRGTGMAPSEFVELGWCAEKNKAFYRTNAASIASAWQRKHRQKMTSDYEQAMFLIGACTPESGIKVEDTLNNTNFRPHQALRALLEWHVRKGPDKETRLAAATAFKLYDSWEKRNERVVRQLSLYRDEE